MHFISASLGVECDFCHVAGKLDSDDKKPKQAAGKMIVMALAINKESFAGHTEVSCYSCHRGEHRPVGVPPVATADGPPAKPEAPEAGASPTADQILDKYLGAVGGRRSDR